MGALPATVPFARVQEALESLLNVKVEDLVSVVFGIDSVTIEEIRRDPVTGRTFAAGDNIATVTTILGYDR